MITIPGRIPIIIHPLFWLIAFFAGWSWSLQLTGALLSVLIILGSVIFHELGHALTAILFGQKARIELAAFGGFTYREGRKLKLWEEFIVVFNGPVAGFLLFLVAYLVYRTVAIDNPLLAYLIKFTFVANLFWTVVNLVPVLPLDGGHLMSILLEGVFGFKGVKMAIVIGIAIAIAISIFFFALGKFIIGALFLILTFESFRSLRYYKMFSEKDRDVEVQQLLKDASQELQSGNLELALKKFKEVRSRTKEGILFSMATQEMAEIYRNQEQYKAAYDLLIPIKKNLSGESLALFHFLAYMNEDFKTVFDISNKCYQENPSYDTALINALACGALVKAEAAIGWLECSLREGLPSIEQALKREEFDPIRQDQRFLVFERSHLRL
jgi:stage IV sporulation protein FB